MPSAIEKLSGEQQRELQVHVSQATGVTTGEAFRRLQSMTSDKIKSLLDTFKDPGYKALEAMNQIRSICSEDWALKGGVFEPVEADL